MATVTKEQIKEWKDKHGEIWELAVADKVAYVRTPTRKEVSASSTMALTDPIKSNEFLLKTCWLGGDNEIKEVDSYFFGAVSQLEQIVEIKEATIKKL